MIAKPYTVWHELDAEPVAAGRVTLWRVHRGCCEFVTRDRLGNNRLVRVGEGDTVPLPELGRAVTLELLGCRVRTGRVQAWAAVRVEGAELPHPVPSKSKG